MAKDMPSLEALAEHLRDLSKPVDALIEISSSSGGELLVYKTDAVVAGLAIAKDDVNQSFERSYEAFKEFYSSNSSTKHFAEPCFVFCVKCDEDDIERIASEIETNVYFCRKYVLTFSNNINEMLAQLPFLPLEAVSVQGERPETAQTYLRENGVPTELAKHIVVPSVRAPDAIIDLCLEGRYGDLEIESKSRQGIANDSHSLEEAVENSRVKFMTIEGFRAYKRSTTFEFGSDVTFLYGPNGFGKTSFFDAFDFAFTGGIGRLSTESRSSDLSLLATHLDSDLSEARVGIVMGEGDSSYEFIRELSDPKQASINGRKIDRKNLLARVTGANTPSADRIDNLTSLFRATHLFSQEQQELTRDMHDKSELSSDIVSRMLALDDYTSASSKISSVVDRISSRQRVLNKTIDDAIARIQECESLISDLQKNQSTDVVPIDSAPLEAIFSDAEAIGVVVADHTNDANTFRTLRSSVEQIFHSAELREKRLNELYTRALTRDDLVSSRDQLAELQEQATQHFINAEAEALRLRELVTSQGIRVGQLTSTLQSSKTVVRDLGWARTSVPAYRELISSREQIHTQIRQLQEQHTQLQEVSDSAKGLLTSHEALLSSRKDELVKVDGDLNRVSELYGRILELEPTRIKSLELSNLLEARRTSEAEIGTQLDQLSSDQIVAESISNQLKEKLSSLDHNRSELSNLIDKLRSHIDGSSCPFCGHDHGTVDALLAHIKELESQDSLAELRAEVASAQQTVDMISERLANLTSQRNELRKMIGLIDSQLSDAKLELSSLDASAIALGVPIQDRTSFQDSTLALQAQLKSKLDHCREALQSAEQLVADSHAAWVSAEEAATACLVILSNSESALAEVEVRISNLQGDLRFNAEYLELASNDLQKEFASRSVEMNLLSTQLNQAISDAEVTDSTYKATLKLTEESRDLAASYGSRLAEVRSKITTLDGDISEAGVTTTDAASNLTLLIQSAATHRAQVAGLLDRVVSAELAADSLTTAAALQGLKSTSQNESEILANSRKNEKSLSTLRHYFERLLRVVENARNRSVANFTTQYGPRTSVIQKRLRTVYGFEEIDISSIESRISVSVSRQGRKLKPTDFFSQSQQQTLLLGLFLTACSSQTWSRFRPILLDDPVAHFDDLNTYAFLDLIRGLLGGNEGRQFVISTCDERFMQMAVRKFRPLGARARFYRFQSIGSSGPEVLSI